MKLPPVTNAHPNLGILVLFIAWLFGNVTLIAGFDGEQNEVPAAGVFILACVTWWIGYRMGGTKSRLGNAIGWIGLGLWMLNVLGIALALISAHRIADFFLEVAALALVALIVAVALTPARAEVSSR